MTLPCFFALELQCECSQELALAFGASTKIFHSLASSKAQNADTHYNQSALRCAHSHVITRRKLTYSSCTTPAILFQQSDISFVTTLFDYHETQTDTSHLLQASILDRYTILIQLTSSPRFLRRITRQQRTCWWPAFHKRRCFCNSLFRDSDSPACVEARFSNVEPSISR